MMLVVIEFLKFTGLTKTFRVLETIWQFFFRLNCIQDAENKKALMTAKRIEGAQQIMDQIKRNEEARILEEERKNAEQGKSRLVK